MDAIDGARITELVLGHHSMLVPHDSHDALGWGAFVMAPWTGLLRDRTLTVAGQPYPLSGSFPDSAGHLAHHGVARGSAWQRIGDGAWRCEMAPPWPLGGSVEQRLWLGAGHLRIELCLIAGDGPMVAALGWHPWFRRRLDVGDEVQVEVDPAAQQQQRDSRGVPTGSWERLSAPPWDEYLRTGAPVTLRWPGAGALQICSTTEYLIAYTAHPDGVCAEPVTGPAEQLAEMAAGEQLTLIIDLRWKPET
ncbi:aldose epimerase family protein [Nakamurella lactea]|uniref:hypothetical protein n=1 Tax=Nakamurella lactea TaxID=459515 RepID=UPI0004035F58|nr:hypothetical protein [Nakamurella lactea]